MRIRRLLCAIAALTLVGAVPAVANPPERVEFGFFDIFPDEQHGLAVFINITREAFCDWEDSDFEGPAPVTTLIPVKFKEVGLGAVVASLQSATRVDVELWQFDADVPPLVGPCVDTDEQTAPWATGQGVLMANDNDLDVSLTRMNSFGSRFTARVVDDVGGAWHYHAHFRAHIDKSDEFREVAEHTVLKPVGR